MANIASWQPSASIEILKKRSLIIQKIRAFFFERALIEVETPLMAAYGVSDPYNENIVCDYLGKPYYLQTSPEYHLKRLLCAGSPDLFQLSKAFRAEISSKQHNPEFTMLEWYRCGWQYKTLIKEVISLVKTILPDMPVTYYSYQNLFESNCGFNPHDVNVSKLIDFSIEKNIVDRDLKMDIDAWLALIMSHYIEPLLTIKKECSVIYDFPKSQASLAVIDSNIARRFEVYINGIELANGFEELTDPNEQTKRFEEDNKQRLKMGLQEKAIDVYFLSALESGLSQCSGVALGVDRLIMAAFGLNDIKQVISFAMDNDSY